MLAFTSDSLERKINQIHDSQSDQKRPNSMDSMKGIKVGTNKSSRINRVFKTMVIMIIISVIIFQAIRVLSKENE